MQFKYPDHEEDVDSDGDSIMSDSENDLSSKGRTDSVTAWLQTSQRARLALQYHAWNDHQHTRELDQVSRVQASPGSVLSTGTNTANIVVTGRHVPDMQPPRRRSRAQNVTSAPSYDITPSSPDFALTRVITPAQMLRETIMTARNIVSPGTFDHILQDYIPQKQESIFNKPTTTANKPWTIPKKPGTEIKKPDLKPKEQEPAQTKPFWHTTNTVAQAPGLNGHGWRHAVPRLIEGDKGFEEDLGRFPACRRLPKWVIEQARRQGAGRLGSLYPEGCEGGEDDDGDA